MEERARVTEADWEDFWYAPEKFGTWHPEDTKNGDDIVVNMDGGVGGSWEVKSASDFEKVWKEMDEIEPLTPVTQSQRKD